MIRSDSRKVVLFSPFSPDLGGGGTNLRTLVPALNDVDVRWLYTAASAAAQPGSVRVGPPLCGGTPWHDISRVIALWSGLPTRTFRQVMTALTSQGSSRYWVVGNNEGIVVARALVRAGARVHLTIQDDLPDGVFGRSKRYRALTPLVRSGFEETLRRVASIDVTSDGMQRYYRDRLGLASVVVHPFVAALPEVPVFAPPPGELAVGHLGSIYAAEEWRTLLRALRRVAAQQGLRARMLMIGLAQKYRPVAAEFPDMVEVVEDLPEPRAVERLSRCQFLYAMYPFDARSDVFRRTSLPTKVTTYLRCQRPILAHSPDGSTLLDIVDRYGLGVGCRSTDPAAVERAVTLALTSTVDQQTYEKAREQVYGVANVERLRACLDAL